MWKKALLIPLVCFFVLPIAASDVEVVIKVAQPSLILGEPLHTVITVRNTSRRVLDLPFEPIFAGMNPAVIFETHAGAQVTSPTGAPLACREIGSTITATFSWKMGADFDIVVPAGDNVSFYSELGLPASIAGKPGTYGMVAYYEGRGKHAAQEAGIVGPSQSPNASYGCEECWKGFAESAPVTIRLDLPTGIDLTAYNAFKGQLLANAADVLRRFPTCTYAGYALVKLGPKSTMWGLPKQTPEQREIELSIPKGAPREDQEKHRAKLLAAYEDFVTKAERFLQAHPDFAQADLLRKEIANALFLLDRPQQALVYVRAIQAKEGPLAEEAAKTLQVCGEKAAPPVPGRQETLSEVAD